MQETVQFLSKSLNFSAFNVNLPIETWKAVAIVVLIFALLMTMAKMRRHFIDWSFKGALFGIFFGFLLALILEGFLIIGGKTALTEVLGWKNAPKPVQVAIDSGRNKLVQVLGIKDEIPQSFAADNPSADEAVKILQSLNPTDIKKVKSLICEP